MRLPNYLGNFSSALQEYYYELKMIIYGVFVFLQVDIDIVKILSILMIADTVLGIVKCFRVKELKFSFKIMLWGLVSKSIILVIPMILALVALALGFDFVWLVDIVLKVLVVSEAISSFTNILSIKEKKSIENTDYVSKLLHALRYFFKTHIDNFINKIKQ